MREAGWVMQGLERDDWKRLLYPSEPALNQQAMHAGVRIWRNAGWHGVKIIIQKLGYFWLSTEQLFSTGDLSPRTRFVRIAGVAFYWVALLVALAGMKRLIQVDSRLAYTLILYVATATALHLLFAMNTRLRVPLMDPLICVLATFPFMPRRIQSASEQTSSDE